MKNTKPTAASKLIAKFDTQLRDMLLEDLKAFKAKTRFVSNKQDAAHQRLSAAWPSYTSTYLNFSYITYEKRKAMQFVQGLIFLWYI